MNETMNSSAIDCVTSDDSHNTCNGGFDSIHLTSLWKEGIPIIPSQHSLTPISFNNMNYQVLEGDIMTDDIIVDDIKVTTIQTTTSGSISSLPVMMPPHSPCTPQRPRRCITTPIPNTTPNAPWDERNHWSNNQQQYRRFRSVNHSVRSSNSSSTSENSSSTQFLQPTSSSLTLLRPTAMIERNISHSSSSSLSLSDYSGSEIPLSDHDPQVVMESPNAIFFSPRRRLNSSIIQNSNNNNSNRTVTLDHNISLLSTLPVAVVSIPTAMDIESTNSNHDDRIHTSSSSCLSMEDGSHHDNTNIPTRCRWCFFPFSLQRNHPYQRRNLLLLFLIATYTTFGLASPNIQQAASIWLNNNNNHSQHGNIILIDDAVTTTTMINDVPFVTDQDAKRIPTHTDESSSVTVSEITTSSQLRGSTTIGDGSSTTRKDSAMIQNHLSFARGGSSSSSSTTVHANQFPNQPVFIYRRREMNDFYHQPALLQEDTTVTTSWYLNCFVLLMIAMYYAVQREHRKAIVSCATTKCRSGSSGTVHNTHLL